MISVAIATAFPIFREGLLRSLHAERDVLVKSVASDSDAVLRSCSHRSSDVLLLDADLPGLGTVALLRRLRQKGCAVAVALFGAWNPESAATACRTGCLAVLGLHDDPDVYVRAIHFASAGDRFVSDRVQAMLRAPEPRPDGGGGRVERLLTPTELQVLRALGENRTSREIADIMFISYRTVQKHRDNIVRKLELDGSNALLAFAMRLYARKR